MKAETFGSEPYLVRIGDHVTISEGVRFITHDGGVWVFREKDPDIDVFAPIIIGDNVFVGMNSLLLPGTVIGSNCIVGAGAVVRGQIEAGSVVAGVPARHLCTIDEYWTKVSERAVHVRNYGHREKRQWLEERFVKKNCLAELKME